jgi:uncharacterized protein YcbK (DUF882 family)
METANFKPIEFACKCHTKNCCKTKISPTLVAVLELVRAHFKKPVIITSAIRCPEHNRHVDGSERSQHLLGTAADIKVRGVDPLDIYHFLGNTFPNNFGIGLYRGMRRSFVHIDVREDRARWVD